MIALFEVIVFFALYNCPIYSFAFSGCSIIDGSDARAIGETDGIQEIHRPSETWNLVDNGTYSFAGYATGSDLYTNYYFSGKSSMTISVTNDSYSNVLSYSHVQGASHSVSH